MIFFIEAKVPDPAQPFFMFCQSSKKKQKTFEEKRKKKLNKKEGYT